jgi:hypothetical protein
MERREFLMGSLMGSAMLAAGTTTAQAAIPKGRQPDRTLKGRAVDLATSEGQREAWARLLGNTDMTSTKYGFAQGIVQGIRPGEAVRDLVGFTMLSCAKLLPLEGEEKGYRKVLREVGLYTDLASGEIIEEWVNPYFNERVKVVPIANDPFNHTITRFRPDPPNYGGLNRAMPPKRPLDMKFTRRDNTLNLFSHINLFYPSALQPAKWPRESAYPFAQVTEVFLYQIDWRDMQNPRKTSVEYNGTWSRTTPWLPWMLMGPTPGHCQYQTLMGAVDDINQIDRKTLDYIEKKMPLYLKAPDTWEEPSLSSLEWYSRQQTPAPLPADGKPPRAPDPELPAWFKAIMEKQGGRPTGS